MNYFVVMECGHCGASISSPVFDNGVSFNSSYNPLGMIFFKTTIWKSWEEIHTVMKDVCCGNPLYVWTNPTVMEMDERLDTLSEDTKEDRIDWVVGELR